MKLQLKDNDDEFKNTWHERTDERPHWDGAPKEVREKAKKAGKQPKKKKVLKVI